MNSSCPPRLCKGRRAIALVIVLAFVVLLTGLTVAFFSSSVLYRQISNSSANEAKVDLFAQGAMDTIVGDLKQEIAAGSNATLYTDANSNVAGQVYRPFNANTAVPAQALKGSSSEQSGVTSYAPNLVKRSAYTQNFFPAGSDAGSANYNTGNTSETISASATPSASPPSAPVRSPSNRAANVATTAASLNGRSISLARWNKALLLPKANPASDTDFTPITPANPSTAAPSPTPGTSEFVAPDWVLVARDGSNPTGAFNGGTVTSTSGSSSVIGRYGYAIYDEGGILDANVAGYPRNIFNVGDTKIPPYKSAQAFADLTQLPGINALAATRQLAVVNSLVGWRNYATAQPNSGTLAGANFNFTGTPLTNFSTAMLANTNGFLGTSNTAIYKGQTDRMLASRQELMRLMLNGIAQQGTAAAAVSDRANIQTALQYLGTFSRNVNQPSYIPATFTDATAPTVLQDGTYFENHSSFGGNSAFTGDKTINPSFLEKRVSAAFTRNDGTTAAMGEPLVLRRFALNRLSWVTYAGPSANNMSDKSVMASITGMGGNPSNTSDPIYLFVQQGNAANVYKYFGLTWDSTKHCWVYDHNSITPPTSPPVPKQAGSQTTIIATLDRITGREPDFFELLRASINVGSLGKHGSLPRSGGTGGDTGAPNNAGTLIQYRRDVLVDTQALQIGANIIDQFDADNYPTRILIWDALSTTPGTREIAGVENLPYIYRTRGGCVRLLEPAAALTSVNDNTDETKTGAVALMIFPELWNPHDQNSSVVSNAVAGINPVTSFRVVVNSVDPDHLGSTPPSEATMNLAQNVNAYSQLPSSLVASPRLSNPKTVTDVTPSTSTSRTPMISFTIQNQSGVTTAFREPTILMGAGSSAPYVPTGVTLAACTLDPNDSLGTWTSNGGLKSSVSPGGTIPNGGGTYAASGLPSTYNGTPFFGPFAGLVLGRAPLKYYDPNVPAPVPPAPPYTGTSVGSLMGYFPGAGTVTSLTIRLQYLDAWSNYVTYCEKAPPLLDATGTALLVAGGDNTIEDGFDPRSSRFGMMQNRFTGSPTWVFSNPATFNYQTYTDRSFTDSAPASNPTGMFNADFGRGLPQTPDSGGASTAKPASGWSGNPLGWNDPNGIRLYPATLVQNDPKVFPNKSAVSNAMYADADGVVRRAMGGFMPQTWAAWSPGSPYSGGTASTYGNPLITGNNQSRPMILNRPFRNVAELGYVYRDTPWKNLDFFSPESGDAALLDVFCINDTDSPTQLQAGKVNLNTQQEAVIRAILAGGTASTPAGAYKDEEVNLGVSGAVAPMNPTEATNIAKYAFTPWRNSTMAPARNLAGFISQWNTAKYAANYVDQTDSARMPTGKKYGIDGASSYSGFANEMTTVDPNGTPGSSLTTGMFTNNLTQPVFTSQTDFSWNIQRFREAPTRALTAVGQTRTWNLMIDMVAQTGRYPTTAGSLSNFIVEGEQRYWVHLAIDRFTGQVVDKQVEIVKE